MKKYISIFSIVLLISLSSCFEEYNEGYDLVGRVATIPVMTLSPTSGRVGATVNVNFRYFSENEDVIQLKLIQIAAGQATEIATKAISGHNRQNSYNDTFAYTVPALSPGAITLRVEVMTSNNLSNGRNVNFTILP
ncbi:hypothetical protein M3O96_17960 [Aquiflexum sp. TKW24L]|uniref:hypothetical protein n=1 Tax=Aquiflexum sp. TKW24L TaxID=2942212 RepID=UPI0020C113BA|nr:hypothetical protein [Aquiflexum sp. TKW24L]MCL6260995.1 hypothetical protein [Aquiflexum sp. TKW24L]